MSDFGNDFDNDFANDYQYDFDNDCDNDYEYDFDKDFDNDFKNIFGNDFDNDFDNDCGRMVQTQVGNQPHWPLAGSKVKPTNDHFFSKPSFQPLFNGCFDQEMKARKSTFLGSK